MDQQTQLGAELPNHIIPPTEPMSTNKNISKRVVLVFVLLFLIFGIGIFSKSRLESPIPSDEKTYTIESESADIPEAVIKLLSTDVPVDAFDYAKEATLGFASNCQPELFDPNIKSTINPATNEEQLGAQYSANIATFTCESDFGDYQDFVIEIKRDGIRQSLFTHVSDYSISQDKKYLFLVNEVKNSASKWSSKRRIIDIVNKRETLLPKMGCSLGNTSWSNDDLVSFSGPYNPEGPAELCRWNSEGKLLSHLSANVSWTDYAYNDTFGFLKKDPAVFYIKDSYPSNSNGDCYIHAQDTQDQNRKKEIRFAHLTSSHGACPASSINLDAAMLDSLKESPVKTIAVSYLKTFKDEGIGFEFQYFADALVRNEGCNQLGNTCTGNLEIVPRNTRYKGVIVQTHRNDSSEKEDPNDPGVRINNSSIVKIVGNDELSKIIISTFKFTK